MTDGMRSGGCAVPAASTMWGACRHPEVVTRPRAVVMGLGILVPARERTLTPKVLEDVYLEFLTGPAIHAAISVWSTGEDGETVLARARDALKQSRA